MHKTEQLAQITIHNSAMGYFLQDNKQKRLNAKGHFMPSGYVIKTEGFTLVEVLVAMVIMAVGLLGLASLQAVALKDNQDAFLRSQANFLAYEMSDRMRANANYWRNQNTDALLQAVITNAQNDTASNHPNCNVMDPSAGASKNCADWEQAEYDVYRWWQDVSAALPNATIAIIWEDDARTATVSNEVIDLILTWDRSNQTVNISRNNAGTSTARLELDVRL